MNILPFISALILLFALGSYSLVYTLKATTEEKRDYQTHLHLQRKFLSDLEYAQYIAKKRPTERKKRPSEHKKIEIKNSVIRSKRGSTLSFRNKLRFSEESKLQIGLLFSPNSPPLLEKITLELIRRLYEFTSIYRPGMEQKVVTTIKKVKQEFPQITSFEELFQHLPSDDISLFYPLMKGTQAYTLFENRGYPALPDFISLKKTNQPLCFPKAHKVHLLAFFGDAFTAEILQEEEEVQKKEQKIRSLRKKEFEPLLLQAFKNAKEFLGLLRFSPREEKESAEFIVIQEKGLTLKIPSSKGKRI